MDKRKICSLRYADERTEILTANELEPAATFFRWVECFSRKANLVLNQVLESPHQIYVAVLDIEKIKKTTKIKIYQVKA